MWLSTGHCPQDCTTASIGSAQMEPTTSNQASTADQTPKEASSRENEYMCDVEDDNEPEDEDNNDEADNTVCETADGR